MHNTLLRRNDAVPAAIFFPSALFIWGALALFVTSSAVAEVSQKTAVVLEPKIDGPIIPQDLTVIEKAVQTALKEQQFLVASKSERDSMASAENIKSCYRNDCLERLGRLLGAHSVLAYKIKVAIVEVPTPSPPPEPRRKGRGNFDAASGEPSPIGSTPLHWEVSAALYNIEVGAIGARVEMKCEHCSGPQVAQNTAELVKRAVLEDASKQRELLEIVSEPSNSSVLVDGVELGVTPYRRSTFVGEHKITVRHTGYKSRNQDIVISENRKTLLNFQLEPGADPVRYITEYQPRPTWRLALGGAMIGVGLAGIGYGAYALAVDGQCSSPIEPPNKVCKWIYDGKAHGYGFVTAGIVMAAAGAVVMILPGKRNPLTPDLGADTFGDKDKPANKRTAKPAPLAGFTLGGVGTGLGTQVFGSF